MERMNGGTRKRNDGDDAGVSLAIPRYENVGEATVVDLSADGLPFIPVLGEAHYSRVGFDPDRHVHPGLVEILLCRRGRGVSIDCADRSYPFPPGTVMVLQPEVPHVLAPKPKGLLTTWIWIRLPPRGKALPGMTLRETRWLSGRLSSLPITFPASKDLVQSFRRIWRLYRDVPRDASERRLVMREAAMRLLMDVLDSSEASHHGTDDERLVALLDEVRRDCAADWPLETLASRAAMSVPKLTECVRRLTGLPPHQFVVSCRMEKAKELLERTDRDIGDIANSLGIATAQHFATLFRRETGLSPLAWRASRR